MSFACASLADGQGGGRSRGLLHRAADARRPPAGAARARSRSRRPGAATSPASSRRRSTAASRPTRRPTTGTSWPWRASGCARRPASETRCRGSTRRSIASWTCSRRGACTAIPTTRWPTTTSRASGCSTCSTRATGAVTRRRWRNWSSAARGCRSSCSRRGANCRAEAAAPITSGTRPQQAVTFESWASRFAKRGDLRGGRRLQMAPQRVRRCRCGRWHRPSGELWIVKNRMDPAARHGYESYSFHSQYNLLAAAMLAMAWSARRRPHRHGAGARLTVGGFAFALQPRVPQGRSRTPGGFYLEYRHRRRPPLQPDRPPPRAPLPACRPRCCRTVSPLAASYQLPSKPTRSMALGPEWRDRSGAWHALADHGREDLEPAEFALRVGVDSASGRGPADLSRPTAWRRRRDHAST